MNDLAIRIVASIFKELHNRRGFRQTFESLDADVENELLGSLIDVVAMELKIAQGKLEL